MWMWVLVMLIGLAACAPVSVEPRSIAMQSIEATRQAAGEQAAMYATAAVATQQALETQMAMSDQQAVLAVTAQALEVEQAEMAIVHAEALAVLDEQLREVELQERQAGLPLTQVAMDATATAITAESMERVDRQQQVEVISILVPVLICTLGFTVIGTLGYGLVTYIRVWNDKHRVVETSLGPVLLLPMGNWRNLDLLEGGEDLNELPTQGGLQTRPYGEVWTSPGGSTVFSSPGARGPRDEQALVRNFLRNAAAEAGPLEQQFPRWERMGWHSEQWQRATGLLREAGLVIVREREGTWINTERYPNIGALSAAVHMRMVDF